MEARYIRKSTVSSVVKQYFVTMEKVRFFQKRDEEPPEALFDEAYQLTSELTLLPANSQQELVDKARLVLDWVAGDDLPAELSASLCRDVLQLFGVRSDDASPEVSPTGRRP